MGYPEPALVTNRTSVLLFGGSVSERRAWAEEAASSFPEEGPLRAAGDDAELTRAFGGTRGVVFIPDICAIGTTVQAELTRILREREERPKFVVGLIGNPVAARDQGRMRWDLSYALEISRVNLDDAALKDEISERRARAPVPKPEKPVKTAGKVSKPRKR
jgi:hypothetical protein